MTQEIVVDARWLEPPEPMERVLLALNLLRPGQRVRFLIHREPMPLYEVLDEKGFTWRTRPIEDGCYELLIEPVAEPA